MSKDYLDNNRGKITASKLKAFIECPESYRLAYIEEVDIPSTPSLELWTAAHYLLSDWWDRFNEKYLIMEKGKKRTKKLLEEESREILTHSDWLKLNILWDEIKRQPLFDLEWDYECEKEIIDGDLKCTADRIDVKEGVIRDLKFVQKVERFEIDYFSHLWFNYKLQADFYAYVASKVFLKPFRFLFDVVTHSWEYMCFEYIPEIDSEMFEGIKDIQEAKDYHPRVFRDWCIKCRYYKFCSKTAIQVKPKMLWE